MSNIEPSHRPFQYSLSSLFVLTTVVAVFCSLGVATDWGFPIALAAGVGFCFIGFGPLSLRRHPKAGCVFVTVGFLLRFLGPLLIVYGLMYFTDWLLGRLLR
jgi:hypothetical protein